MATFAPSPLRAAGAGKSPLKVTATSKTAGRVRRGARGDLGGGGAVGCWAIAGRVNVGGPPRPLAAADSRCRHHAQRAAMPAAGAGQQAAALPPAACGGRPTASCLLSPRPPLPASPLPQLDRYIPNRSASNLDVASYNVSREARDVENLDALSPSKVGAQWWRAWLDGALCRVWAPHLPQASSNPVGAARQRPPVELPGIDQPQRAMRSRRSRAAHTLPHPTRPPTRPPRSWSTRSSWPPTWARTAPPASWPSSRRRPRRPRATRTPWPASTRPTRARAPRRPSAPCRSSPTASWTPPTSWTTTTSTCWTGGPPTRCEGPGGQAGAGGRLGLVAGEAGTTPAVGLQGGGQACGATSHTV